MIHFFKPSKKKYRLIKNIFNISKIDNNSNFQIEDDRVKCFIERKYDIVSINESINKRCYKINKHKIISRFINSNILRYSTFGIINLASIVIPTIINSSININYLTPSLLLSLPFTYYTSMEKKFSDNCVTDINKYDVYHKMDSIYQRIIDNFCMLIYKLKINDPIDIMIIYSETIGRMIKNNDISDEEYDNNVSKIEYIFDSILDTFTVKKFGYNVLLGYANCKNQSAILKDILVRLGFDASVLYLKNFTGNKDFSGHAIVQVNGENSYRYLDPQFFCNYKRKGKMLVSENETSFLFNINNIKFKVFMFHGIRSSIKYDKPVSYTQNVQDRRNKLLKSITNKKEIKVFNDVLLKYCKEFECLYEELIKMYEKSQKRYIMLWD